MKEELNNDLWTKFKNGDKNAISELFKNLAHELYSYGLSISNEEILVEDSIQDVFFQLIHKRNLISVTSNIRLYIFKSLRNKIVEELRSKKRKRFVSSEYRTMDNAFDQSIEQSIIDNEEENNVMKNLKVAIDELPSRQKEIIYLRYTEGFNYHEIADLLNIEIASARTLLYRSLKAIKNHFNDKNILICCGVNLFFFIFTV